MKKGILGIFFCWWGMFAYGQYQEALQQLLETEGLEHAAIGISVKKVANGQPVVTYQDQMALTPASVAKIIPTWFALQEKGKNFRFHTLIHYTGEIKDSILVGNITLLAAGDPTLDSRYFPHHTLVTPLVAAIGKAGIKCIQGDVLVEGAEVGTHIPGSWAWEDISNYYGASYLPFNYRDNTFTLLLQSGQPGTETKLLSVTPALPEVKIKNEVKAATNKKDDAWIFGGPYSRVLCVKGTIPAGRKSFKVKGAMHDPAACFIQEVKEALKQKNIEVKGQQCTSNKSTLLLQLYSPRLEEIVFHTNKSSINLFAEALGHLVANGDNWTDRLSALFSQLHLDASGITLKDASGLSVFDAVPACLFTDLLVNIGQQKENAFIRSLPVAGIDGGLAGYCSAWPLLKNNLKAKTGSMSGVRCLAGFLVDKTGEQLAFTVMINHYKCTTSQLQKAIGRFLNHLYTFPD